MTFTILPESAPAPAPRRPTVPRQLVAVIAGLAVIAAAGVAYLLTRGSDRPAARPAAKSVVDPTPKSAVEWLSTAMAAAKAQGAVHVEVVNKLKGRTSRFSDDDGAGAGIQRITVTPGMRAEVRVMPGVTYFAANRAALEGYFGFSASLARRGANRWLILRPGNPGYATVTEGVTFASMMKEMSLRGPLKMLPSRKMFGVQVVGIRGTAAGPAIKHHRRATATLWIATSGAHLPVLYAGNVPRLGTTSTHFSRWGVAVKVAAPGPAA